MAKVATTSFYAPAGDGSERLVREGHVVADTDPVVEGREALFTDADEEVSPTRPVFVAEPQDPTAFDDSVLFVGDDDEDAPVDVEDPADAPAPRRGRTGKA